MAGQDLTGADLRGANLAGTNLRGCNLFRAQLSGADLLGADLSGAELGECTAERASFGGANLEDARFFNAKLAHATFSKAKMRAVDMRAADLTGCRLVEADLRNANFRAATLVEAEFSDARLDHSIFDEGDLRRAVLRRVKHFGSSSWIDADITDGDFTRSLTLRRFIADENYLHELKTRDRRGAILYWLWWASSDCGRSFTRWFAWTALVTVLFAFAYTFVALDYGDHETQLSPLYFSIVTLTSLGFGDVLPASVPAQLLVMAEIVVGYCLLGGLISIMSNKIARRAE